LTEGCRYNQGKRLIPWIVGEREFPYQQENMKPMFLQNLSGYYDVIDLLWIFNMHYWLFG